jgi:titin
MKTFLVLFTCSLFANVALTATYTVTNTNDAGAGSLRQALTDANNNFAADYVYFNIPTSDPNYDAVHGVWRITPVTALPGLLTGNTHVDGNTQTINQGDMNPLGPEILIDGSGALQYGLGIVSPGNIIQSLIIGNFQYGILVYNNTSTNCMVAGCWLGLDADGVTPMPNEYGIVFNNNTHGHSIRNSVISGNTAGGVGISVAYDIEVVGNIIGLSADGSTAVPNPSGILINEAYGNTIGGTAMGYRNFISGNTDAGITITGTGSYQNGIYHNFIGCGMDGFTKMANGNGIIIAQSRDNIIGGNDMFYRNVISGNDAGGIVLSNSGANNNVIKGNYIGVDSSGLGILENHTGVLLMSNANNNIIGGAGPGEGNVLSGNIEIGVYIEACDSNLVIGNLIGPDATGTGSLDTGGILFQGNGIEVNTVSAYNRIGGNAPGERNIISGNRVYGMIYYGNVSNNPLIGNYIGTDITGNVALPNATGICVDGGSNHNKIENNVLSGNISYGIFIVTTGTYYNEMYGNLIGTNAAGTDSIPNDIGLLLGGGARYNIIGGTGAGQRNLISGNRYAGIEAADIGTSYNEIRGNYIGTDITGNLELGNFHGIGFATNPSSNTIEQNLISGNRGFGIILYEQSETNQILQNHIGTKADGVSDLGNHLAGILIASGSVNNEISENVIAFNDSSGIVLMDNTTLYNTIQRNSIYQNYGLGIDILDPGPNANDAGDVDDGPNAGMNYPVITSAIVNVGGGQLEVQGTLDTYQPELCVIELFIADPDPLGYGEGISFLCSVSPDISGNWIAQCFGANEGDVVTATATDNDGNTSEFCANVSLVTGVEQIQNNSPFSIIQNGSDFIAVCEQGLPLSAEVTDIQGRLLMKKTGHDGQININLSGFSNGIYLLTLSNGMSACSSKLIITNE